MESYEMSRLERDSRNSGTDVASTHRAWYPEVKVLWFILFACWFSSDPFFFSSLANAELSTSSRSHHIIARSLYLCHQFSFYALGEDCHALIRRFHLDIGSCKIEVRREVEVSAYSAGTRESFVEGLSTALHVRRASSSFDEPMASVLSAGLDHFSPLEPSSQCFPTAPPVRSQSLSETPFLFAIWQQVSGAFGAKSTKFVHHG
jgi:hypothetical protein